MSSRLGGDEQHVRSFWHWQNEGEAAWKRQLYTQMLHVLSLCMMHPLQQNAGAVNPGVLAGAPLSPHESSRSADGGSVIPDQDTAALHGRDGGGRLHL